MPDISEPPNVLLVPAMQSPGEDLSGFDAALALCKSAQGSDSNDGIVLMVDRFAATHEWVDALQGALGLDDSRVPLVLVNSPRSFDRAMQIYTGRYQLVVALADVPNLRAWFEHHGLDPVPLAGGVIQPAVFADDKLQLSFPESSG